MAKDFSFIDHVRFGLASRVAAGAGPRGTVSLTLSVSGDGAGLDIPLAPVVLRGPPDVAGFRAAAVLRTEPVAGAPDFDCTALAAVDFHDEDFPWRYTPIAVQAAARGGRVTPWLTLLVLADGEYVQDNGRLTEIAPHAVPDPAQAWAWAHVQVNQALSGSVEATRRDLATVLATDPGQAFSRLLSPRRLSPLTTYSGFVVPTFETGRLAAMGQRVDGVAATTFAYARATTPPPLPVYFSFSFRTGEDGNFEALVRRLKPFVPQPEMNIGRRLMDMTPWHGDPQKGKIDSTKALWLEGALRVPAFPPGGGKPPPALAGETRIGAPPGTWGNTDHEAFAVALGTLLQAGLGRNRKVPKAAHLDADDEPNDSLLPLVAPPVYGANHAAIHAVEPNADGQTTPPWIGDLNFDPAYRIGAGFGTRDIQRNQEDYMARAWSQYGDLFKVNGFVRLAQFWQSVERGLFDRTVAAATVDPAVVLRIARPAEALISVGAGTVRTALTPTTMTPSMLGGAFARATRPGAPLVRRAVVAKAGLTPLEVARRKASLATEAVSAVATRELIVAPTIRRPAGRITLGVAAAPLALAAAAELAVERPDRVLGIPEVDLATLQEAAQGLIRPVTPAPGTQAQGLMQLRLNRQDDVRAPRGMARFATRSVQLFGQRVRPQADLAIGPASITQSLLQPSLFSAKDFATAKLDIRVLARDDALAERFGITPDNSDGWRALREAFIAVQQRIDLDVETTLRPGAKADLPGLADAARAALEPAAAMRARVRARLDFGDLQLTDRLDPIMPAPEFEDPMQHQLAPLGKEERLLPNISAIPNNSVTLLQNNAPFIEAYMAGLNHEFAREMLWREYPSDGRGTCFRRFWDTNDCPGLDDAARDTIRPMHHWSKRLGDHPANDLARDATVIAIRGDLLRRYPNTDIYAVRAWWVPDHPDAATAEQIAERFHVKSWSSWERLPDRAEWDARHGAEGDHIRWPIFKGKAADCTFIGLPLTPAQMRGDGQRGGAEPGWYIVLREKVGEPRFGADDQAFTRGRPAAPLPAPMTSWNDFDWFHVGLSAAQIDADPARWRMLDVDRMPVVGGLAPRDGHAGELAADLLQKPVQIYIHAAELLRHAP